MEIDSDTLLPKFKLIAFPVSHYCEKVRWSLRKFNFPFIEERHAPFFHYLHTIRRGGKSVPILVAGEKNITDSTDILEYLDQFAPEALKLYPSEPLLYEEVKYWEQVFNTQLGELIRLWGYSYTLKKTTLVKKRFTYGVPFYEKLCFPMVFPIVNLMIHRHYNVNEKTRNSAIEKITEIFESVAQKLSTGQTYLLGNRFTAADLTFATLSTPIIRPPEYGDPDLDLSNLEQLPSKMSQEVQRFRSMPAGEYALRLWREHKNSLV